MRLLATVAGDVIGDAEKGIDAAKHAGAWMRGDPLGVLAVVFFALWLGTVAYLIWRTRRFDMREDAHEKQEDAMREGIERAQQRATDAVMVLARLHDQPTHEETKP